ncbi:MAG: 5-formyltetrahydrofolate cyclo-ligase [Acetatifactor sp.]
MRNSTLKSCLRREVLAKRDAMTAEDRKRENELLTGAVTQHPLFVTSDKVLLFAGYGSEADTSGMIREAFVSGKKVYLPKVVSGSDIPTMIFYRIENRDQLQSGYRGIPEPAGDTEQYVFSETEAGRTFVLLPGVAFDRQGNRMGYGKGFYDRFLAKYPALIKRTLAIGFACQMVEQIPVEEYDIKPNSILCL